MTVKPGGTVTFRYDYRLNGRRETLALGRHGPGGISLAMARELLLDARKAVLKGVSSALEKQCEKRRMVAIKTFGTAMDTWLANARLADSTRAMRKHIIDREIVKQVYVYAIAHGEKVDIYRRSVMLASGRYALLDDGKGFSLVRWKPVIEERFGQQLAATIRGGGVSWEIGRRHGLGIS